MDILIGSLGSLVSVGVLVFSFQRLKMLYKAKQDPLLIIAVLCIFLIELCWVALVLAYLSQAIFGAGGAKMPFEHRLLSIERACLHSGSFLVFLFLICCFYLSTVRPRISAINRRRQRKELVRLGWQERKPGAKLDAGDFKYLFIIGITSWKSEDLRGIETLQRYFRHDDWTVQALFLEDTHAWPTPTVYEYQDGVLIRRLSGKEALTWMKQA